MRLTTIFVVFFVLCITEVRGRSLSEEKRLLDELNGLDDELKKISDKLKDLSNDGKKNDAVYPIDDILRIDSHLEEEPNVTLTDGDIAQPDPTKLDGNEKRNAIRGTDRLWKSRNIAYTLDQNFDTRATSAISAAMNTITSISCITFTPRNGGEIPFISFVKDNGCWSYVGYYSYMTDGQKVSIGNGCESEGIVMHELLHALGFYHEQSRYDRNDYVTIYWENIMPGFESNFNRKDRSQTRNLDTPYDYESIMHYSKTAFSTSNQPTIEATGDSSKALGQRNNLSQQDIISLNLLYHCSDDTFSQNEWTQWSDYGDCHAFSSQDCSQKRYRYCPGENTCNCDKASYNLCKVESKSCSVENCKLDGHWGRWTSWTSCSGVEECSQGTKKRTRVCNEPSPLFGGQQCPGEAEESIDCFATCPKRCTFEEDLCGYTATYETDDSKVWTRHRGPTTSSGTGPSTDSTGSADGFFVYTEVSGGFPSGLNSFLESKIFDGSSNPQCYTFSYHMFGDNVGNLAVYLSDSTGDSEQFSKAGDQGDKWNEAAFEINKNNQFWIKIVATYGGGWSGDIALDNLFLSDGSCGSTPVTTTTTPSTSSSTSTAKSTTTTPSTTSSTTTTKSTTTTPTTTSSTTTTKSTTTTTTSTTPTTSTTSSTTTTKSTTPTTSTTSSTSTTTTTAPPTTIEPYVPVTKLSKFKCSMNGGSLCGMTQQRPFWATSSDFVKWDVVQGDIPERDVIPGRTGDISYLLALYATSPENVARRSSIKTHEFQGNNREWIEFYYFMSNENADGSLGDQIALLEVSVVNEAGQSCVVFNTTTGRNGVWEYARAPVKVNRRDKFSLVFTGVLGSEDTIIAIDDIRGLYFAPSVTNSYPNVKSPSALECSFNAGDTCLWENNGINGWAPSSADNALPAFKNNEPYLSSESQGEEMYVKLSSGIMYTKDFACMVVPAIVLGATNSLRVNRTVYKVVKGKATAVKSTKDLSNPIGDWKKRYYALPKSVSFEIYIEAKVRPSNDGTISAVSIDDIEVIPGKCPNNGSANKGKGKGKKDEEIFGDPFEDLFDDDLFLL